MYLEDSLWGDALKDDSTTIWRYLTLYAFLYFLQNKTLFFHSLARLAKDDPWEGRWSEQECPGLHATLQNALDNVHWPEVTTKHLRESTFVNCWHRNDCES